MLTRTNELCKKYLKSTEKVIEKVKEIPQRNAGVVAKAVEKIDEALAKVVEGSWAFAVSLKRLMFGSEEIVLEPPKLNYLKAISERFRQIERERLQRLKERSDVNVEEISI